MKLRVVSKKFFQRYCPYLFCNSWEESNSIMIIFPKFNLKNALTLICLYLYYLAFMIDGLFYLWIDTRFLLIPTTILGPFMHIIHIICVTGFGECILFRTYCLYKMIRFGRSSIVWHTILLKINQSDHPKLFNVSKFLFFQLFVGASAVFTANHIAKLVEWSNLLDYVVHIGWIFIQIGLLRFTPSEFPYFYIAAYSCYLYVKEQMDLLLKQFREPLLDIQLVSEYLKLIKLVKQVNPLMKLISLTNSLTVIPYAGSVIVTIITYPQNDLQLVIKYSYLMTALLFSVRGVIMTIVLANIDCRSKMLYKLLASRIARGQITGFVSVRQLMLIMDDLASHKNHLVMKEYSGSPANQMDVMVNVLSIPQFVMLVMQFSLKFVF